MKLNLVCAAGHRWFAPQEVVRSKLTDRVERSPACFVGRECGRDGCKESLKRVRGRWA